MQALPDDNGPDQGQALAAADSWRADGTQREPEMRIEVRGSAIRCFSAPHRQICSSPVQPPPLFLHATTTSAAPPRAACRSIRLLCGSADRLSTHAGSRVILAVRRWKRGDGGGEQGHDGRLLEAIEIATMEDKDLVEEALNNNIWTSSGARQTNLLEKLGWLTRALA